MHAHMYTCFVYHKLGLSTKAVRILFGWVRLSSLVLAWWCVHAHVHMHMHTQKYMSHKPVCVMCVFTYSHIDLRDLSCTVKQCPGATHMFARIYTHSVSFFTLSAWTIKNSKHAYIQIKIHSCARIHMRADRSKDPPNMPILNSSYSCMHGCAHVYVRIPAAATMVSIDICSSHSVHTHARIYTPNTCIHTHTYIQMQFERSFRLDLRSGHSCGHVPRVGLWNSRWQVIYTHI